MRGVRSTIWCWTIAASLAGAVTVFAETETKTVRVSATILPRLELSVTPETGEEITFGAITQPAPGEATSRSIKVAVNAFSNLGTPYHITQMVRQPLTSPEGLVIANEQFQVLTTGASRGTLGSSEPTPIVAGTPTTLYRSNARGKSDAFSAEYTLTVTSDTPAGEFDTEIVYTVTSL